MALQHIGYVDLPPHITPGGFDHAAVHRASARLYVAHTCNDALDVIDSASDHYLRSIPNLTVRVHHIVNTFWYSFRSDRAHHIVNTLRRRPNRLNCVCNGVTGSARL